MTKILLVILGGSIGAVARYGVNVLSARWLGDRFPWGTLGVNLSGCLMIGLVFGLAERNLVDPQFRLFFVTGFLGALTTFSSFAIETVLAAQGGALTVAVVNFAVNNVGGILLAVAGLRLARIF